MSRKTFIRGAAVLGIAGLMVQVMGAIFRIPIGNIIGDEGMGYYQTAYPIYVFLLVFSTNGAPAAISKMVSERIAIGQAGEAHRVFKVSFILMAAIGVVAAAIFLFGARPIVTLLKNPGAYYSMIAIAPALLFVPLMAVFRGYFQGMQEMEPTAVSQLAEQAVRVAVGLSLAIYLVSSGSELAAAGASAGTSVGPIVGTLVLIRLYQKRRGRIQQAIAAEGQKHFEKAGDLLKQLAAIAVPITIGVSILPIMNIVDVALVMRRLQDTGFTMQEANALYGQLTGMAGPVINIPMALALSIALSLVPAIAAAKSTGDEPFLQTNIRLGLRTSMIIGVPCSFGLMALAEPIMLLFYPLQKASAVSAAGSLFYLSTGIIFLSIAQTMAGILQGLGKPMLPVKSLVVGILVKIVLTWWLCGIPALHVQGAAIGSAVAYLFIGMINLWYVKGLAGTSFQPGLSVGKPLIAGTAMAVVVVLFSRLLTGILGNSISTLAAVSFGAAVYGILLLRIRAIEPGEIRLMPKGEKLVRLLVKLRLVSED